VGGINESDVSLAMASQAVLIGFNVRADNAARRLVEKESLEIYYSGIIYDIVDNVKRAINGLLGPQFKENILGLAEVRNVFRSAKLGAVAGCMVIEGIVKRGCPIRVLRDNVVIYQGELESLRRFKEDTAEVRHGMECGIGVKNYNDVKPGDQIEVFETVEVARG
jgi:translation initiation factor IF-2